MQVSNVHLLAIRTRGPEKNLFGKGREQEEDRIHTGDIRVWTEVKRTIVVSRWASTVGRNIFLDFQSEVKVVDHVL